MPKGSKRTAARQAALSRKKKGSKPSVYRPPSTGARTDVEGAASSSSRADIPTGALPEFEVPDQAFMEASATTGSSAAPSNPLSPKHAGEMRMPYLRTDLKLTARAGALLLLALIVLKIFI